MNWLNKAVQFYERQYVALLFALLALTLCAAAVAATLSVDADLSSLLPESAPSVKGLNRLETAYDGQVGRLTVVLESTEIERAKEAALHLEAVYQTLDGVDHVEVTRPLDFFEQYRLLYVSYEDLHEVSERIQRRIRWEQRQANPLFVDVLGTGPPTVDLSDIEQRYEGLDEDRFFVSKDGRTLVFFIHPDFPASDLDQSQMLVEQVGRVTRDHLQRFYPAVSFALTGRYTKRVEQQLIVAQDLRYATGIALMLLTLFLLGYFRNIWASMLVVVPLIVGTVWSFAWAAAVFQTLNFLTGFLGAILLGLGVDYGIHIVSRYFDLRASDKTVSEALIVTMLTAGRASLFAGVTTIVAMGSLAISSFQAFFEFGIVAMGGMSLILLAYTTVLPGLVLLLSRFSIRPTAPVSVSIASALTRWFGEALSGENATNTRVRRLYFGALGGVVGMIVLALIAIPSVELVRDFRTLEMTETTAARLDRLVNEILGQSQAPAVVLVNSVAHAERVAEELRRRQQEEPQGYTISEVFTLSDVLPDRQTEKQRLLTELRADLESVPAEQRSDELESFLWEIETVLAQAPLGIASLPESLQRPFARADDPRASTVIVLPSTPMLVADEIIDYATVLRDLPVAYGAVAETQLDAISDSLLLADIIDFVQRDTAWMVVITLMGLFMLTGIAFGVSREFLLIQLTLALALSAAISISALFGVYFNFINLVIIPVWLGLAIDAGFHMYFLMREDIDSLRPHFAVALTICAAFVTSMIGFGALLVSRHPGLYSLGQIAVVGLGIILITSLLVQLVIVLHSFRRRVEVSLNEPHKQATPQPRELATSS